MFAAIITLDGIAPPLSIENAVYGALMGLASTGMHQAFTRFVEGKNEDE